MTKQDKVHFDTYTEQNRVKHKILTKYLPAYLNVLKNRVARFHYIDGFAGPGHYADTNPGSPLLVIDQLIEANVANRAAVSCVEDYEPFSLALKDALAEYPGSAQLFNNPLVQLGKFHDHIDRILRNDVYSTARRGRDVATFAFVDPCGLVGVRLIDIVRLLQLPYGECLLFFNYTGVVRLIGGVHAGSHSRTVLADLLGTDDRVQALLNAVAGQSDKRKEILVRDHFTSAIKNEAGAAFFVPFAVQPSESNRTSHYLIHCSSHSLAFKIMKEVMYGATNDQRDEYGQLTYLNVDELGQQLSFFARQDIEGRKQLILDSLKEPKQVRYFCEEWVLRPDDPFIGKHYKTMLLEMESDGRIIVFSKDGKSLCPAESRRKQKGKVTLGDDYWLRRVSN